MINEILCSLLGITGEVIVLENDAFVLNEKIDVFTSSEREQISSIIQIGYGFRKLVDYVDKYLHIWRSSPSLGNESAPRYQAIFCAGLQDALESYSQEIAFIHSSISIDGPIPLSAFQHKLQKFALLFPILLRISHTIDEEKLIGGQLIDCIARSRTGFSTVNSVIDRVLLRMRAAYMRECMAWMIHGFIDGENCEFFVQNLHLSNGIYGSDVRNISQNFLARSIPRIINGQSDTDGASLLDWNKLVVLKLHLTPESMISTRMIPKLVFSGKAVLVLSYCADNLFKVNEITDGSEVLTKADASEFYRRLAEIVHNRNTEQANFHFENLINDVHNAISIKLWRILRDTFSFSSHATILRNLYFLGSGEFVQLLQDCISSQVRSKGYIGASSRAVLQNALVNCLKFLNLDEQAVARHIQLDVVSDNISIADFAQCLDEVVLIGDARLDDSSIATITSDCSILSKLTSKIVFIPSTNKSDKLRMVPLWSKLLFDIGQAVASTQSCPPSHTSLGSVWLRQEKHVSRGFEFECSFIVNGTNFVENRDDTQCGVLGSICCCLNKSIGMDSNAISECFGCPAGSLIICVAFGVEMVRGRKKLFARLSTRLAGDAHGLGVLFSERKMELGIDESDIHCILRANSVFTLCVEYKRNSRASSISTLSSGLEYLLSARLQHDGASDSDRWDIQTPLDPSQVTWLGGDCFVGIISSCTNAANSHSPFGYDLLRLSFRSNDLYTTYPVACTQTAIQYPETLSRLTAECAKVREWMHLKMTVVLPEIFQIIFDSDTVRTYQKLFSFLMKIRTVSYTLERLWISRSRIVGDRVFNFVRHSMNFFMSNLFFYLQVDVIDSEFSDFQKIVWSATEFQEILRGHRIYLSSIARLAFLENSTVQESIDRILHCCIRFIALCRVIADEEATFALDASKVSGGANEKKVPIVVPIEEILYIRQEFVSQVSFFFQIMRKVENRGFMFRLDFNGYISSLMAPIG